MARFALVVLLVAVLLATAYSRKLLLDAKYEKWSPIVNKAFSEQQQLVSTIMTGLHSSNGYWQNTFANALEKVIN